MLLIQRTHRSSVFKDDSSNLSAEYRAIAKFSSADDPNYLEVLEKVMKFANTRQLLDAARGGSYAMVKTLLKKKEMNINLKDGLGHTALHESVKNGHDSLVERLLRSQNAKVGLADNKGNTALHLAVINRSVSICSIITRKRRKCQRHKRGNTVALGHCQKACRTDRPHTPR